MKPYPCRRMTVTDMQFVKMACQDTRADYWEIVGKPAVPWAADTEAQVTRMTDWVALSPENDRIPVGVIFMSYRREREVPAVQLAGLASKRTLPDRERIGIYLSLLIAGYPDCEAEGIKRGYALLTASNDLILEAMKLVGRFKTDPYKMMPDGVTPAILLAKVEPLDAGYLAALKKALKEL